MITHNSKFQNSFIFNGQQFSNLNSARLASGSDIRFKCFQSSREERGEVREIPSQVFCSPSGQHYLVYRFEDGDLRVDVNNVHTARHLRDQGLTESEAIHLVLSSPSEDWRPLNGWGSFQ